MFNLRKLFSRARDYAERLSDILPYHVTHANVKSALYWVEMAADRYVANNDKRTYVVARLMEKGFTESKARLALELAILLIKKGQD
jgi:predicted Ser/Thr protein kinase